MKQISFLTQADLAIAWQIEQVSHAFPWSETVFYDNQGERYLNFKLVVDQQLVGFAITHVVSDEATLFNLAIHPSFQRCGYGRELLEQVISALVLRQVTTLWLEVRVSNQSAIHLYEQMGFNTVTTRRDYYPTRHGREDAVVMALSI